MDAIADTRKTALDRETLERFLAGLPLVYPAVLARAVRIVAGKRWARGGATLPEGKEAADLVHEAVTRVLDGRRAWAPEQDPDLEWFLTGIVRSLASHLAEGVTNREFGIDDSEAASRRHVAGDAETIVTERESYEERAREVMAAAGADPILRRVVEAVLDGCTKADEVAQTTGLTQQQVYTANRKLKRRIEALRRRS